MSTFKPTFSMVDIVVVVDGEDVLLERRAIPPHMDKLVFPGGHVDAEDPERKIKADPSLTHAAAREAFEEMGLVIKPEELRFFMNFDAPDRDERQDARRVSIAFIVHRTSAEVSGVRAASDAREIVRRKINSLSKEELGFDHWQGILRLQHDVNVSRLFWNEKNEDGLPKHTCPAMVDNAWANDIEIVYSFEEKGAFVQCTESGSADFSERIRFCPVCGVTCPAAAKEAPERYEQPGEERKTDAPDPLRVRVERVSDCMVMFKVVDPKEKIVPVRTTLVETAEGARLVSEPINKKSKQDLVAQVVEDRSGCTLVRVVDLNQELTPVITTLVNDSHGTRMVSAPRKTAKDFFFDVGEEDGSAYATITAQDYWEKHRHVDDSETHDATIMQYGMYSITESTYEPGEQMTAEQLRAKLLTDGFKENAEFTAFLKRCK